MTLDSQLTQLENEQLVRQLLAEEPAYIFKHALVQDTAYESLLKQRRFSSRIDLKGPLAMLIRNVGSIVRKIRAFMQSMYDEAGRT